MVEKDIFAQDPHAVIIGVDEVGRGALAGPIAGGAVAITKNIFDILSVAQEQEGIIVRDSKKMTAKQRVKTAEWLEKHCVHTVFREHATSIDRKGIQMCNNAVLVGSIKGVVQNILSNGESHESIHVFCDYFPLKKIKVETSGAENYDVTELTITTMKFGESHSIAIAAASILAKVRRDAYMIQLGEKYPEYEWGKNKGYGTQSHRDAIKKYGLHLQHRVTFCGKLSK